MEKSAFEEELLRLNGTIETIRALAHHIHDAVNQKYGKIHPYGFHLDMVAENVKNHGADVCSDKSHVLPIIFGAYFHDTIEDARLTYNNVLRHAMQFMDNDQALMATEIVYALTNEKGRTREQRADDRYYAGIRTTPYAPMVKLADRLANFSYSTDSLSTSKSQGMRDVYKQEMEHFLNSITGEIIEPEYSLPQSMLAAIEELMK